MSLLIKGQSFASYLNVKPNYKILIRSYYPRNQKSRIFRTQLNQAHPFH